MMSDASRLEALEKQVASLQQLVTSLQDIVCKQEERIAKLEKKPNKKNEQNSGEQAKGRGKNISKQVMVQKIENHVPNYTFLSQKNWQLWPIIYQSSHWQ